MCASRRRGENQNGPLAPPPPLAIFLLKNPAVLYMQMVALSRDPEGEGVMKSSAGTATASSLHTTSSGTDESSQNIYKLLGTASRNMSGENCDVETVHQLRRKIAELENQIMTYQNV